MSEYWIQCLLISEQVIGYTAKDTRVKTGKQRLTYNRYAINASFYEDSSYVAS